jgi:YbbR domain-containing protein
MKLGERINKLLENRKFLIVFSVLVSIALWVYVEHILNEDIDSLGIRAEVQFLHPELVADRKLVITGTDTDDVTLRFSGKRGVIAELYKQDAVRVTADLANITSPGLNMVEYSVAYGDGIDPKTVTIISRSANYISVQVEKLFEKQLPITALYSGVNVAAEGYQAEPAVFSPEWVTVYGPQSVVESIESVRVDVRRENLTKSVTEDLPFTPLDADGNAVQSDFLSFDRETVGVTIPIRLVKEIALTANLIQGAGASAENTVVTISPEKITLSGDAEALGTLNSLTLATIDVTKFESFYTATVPIVIPNDMSNLTGVAEATVTVTITGLETRRITVPDMNFQITNETPGYTASLITTSVDVAVRGLGRVIETVNAENIRIVADLSEFGDTTGTFTIPAKVYLDGQFGDCGPIGDYKVTVHVEKDPGEQPAARR